MNGGRITKMPQRLEQSGFVSRGRSPADRRAVLVSTARAGQALRDRVLPAWRDLEAVTAAGFTDEDYRRAMRFLARIEENPTGTNGTAPLS